MSAAPPLTPDHFLFQENEENGEPEADEDEEEEVDEEDDGEGRCLSGPAPQIRLALTVRSSR